jgi:hypothetical protein
MNVSTRTKRTHKKYLNVCVFMFEANRKEKILSTRKNHGRASCTKHRDRDIPESRGTTMGATGAVQFCTIGDQKLKFLV